MIGARGLSGQWTGRFDYASGGAPVAFEAVLSDIGGALDGTIVEPNTFAPIAAKTLEASILGSRSGSEVRFVKYYVGFDQGDEPAYAGHVNSNLTRIEGVWWFAAEPEWRGRFMMVRPEPIGLARARAAEVSVE